MIRWLIQSVADHPSLAAGEVPEGLLSPAERARLDSLRTSKRRSDWVLGRWTAKHLVQAAIEADTGTLRPLGTFEVGNNADGSPFVAIGGSRLALDLSISHSGGRAFCAVTPLNAACARVRMVRIGADIERIESRSWRFVEDFFTEAEAERVREAPPGLRETTATAIWSAKEAVLKALHRGLTVDTRRVGCFLGPAGEVPARWTPFEIVCDPTLFDVSDQQRLRLSGWWRVIDANVVTLASVHA